LAAYYIPISMKLPTLLTLALAMFVRADDYEARTFTGPDGGTLHYRLLKPKDYDPAKKYPFVAFFHGAGERGTDNAAQLRHGTKTFLEPKAREQHPCFVFAPQCPPEQTWSAVKGWTEAAAFSEEPKPAMKLALGAIDALLKEFSIDAERLYLTGLSMGGYGTWDLLSRAPERWAAAVPICGGGDPARVAVAKDVAIWAFHGAEDKVVPPERTRELIAVLKAAGGQPLYSEYPYVGHDSWTPAYKEPELLAWLFAQRRGQVVPWAKVASPYAQPPSSEFPGAGPVQSGLWFRPLWREKREKWAQDAAHEQGAVVFFGDSITQGWGSLAQDFPNFKTANRGISGDTTRGLRLRLDDVLALKPRAVSILIGTNDLDQGAEPEVVVENLKAIVGDLLKANPKLPIVINKVMPRGRKAGKFPDKIQALNALYDQAFAGNPQVTFVDTWALFDAGDGQCKKEEFPDLLHPNGAGYAKWSAALRPVLEKLVPKG
jgi:lysophospholipase L1-like esterase/predicted esterase